MRRPSPVEAATLGLAVCYLLNDAEELLTYRASSAWLPVLCAAHAGAECLLAAVDQADGNVAM
ncbi:hypothetical protein [Actinomyces qiguomingii]|uniref:hypothetical protein n=1 Tax=Actinomyces qiguomingii TaxID=2057800 RepID=UPI000FFE7CE1|nr:hypothetical protein [Actinomyces qiguomingii]